MKNYDLAVIGSGPGGYVAALYASRRKMSVCVIEQDLVGGTCLNRGCIPTKSLLNSASIISAINSARAHGIQVGGYAVDLDAIIARKDEVVTRLRAGIETLFKASGIEMIKGKGALAGNGIVSVDGSDAVKASSIIIASGSRASSLPNVVINEKDIMSSDGVLTAKSMPRSIIVVGGGAIGCEFAGLFSLFSSKVTIVELTDRLLPGQSREVSKKLEAIFRKNRIDVHTGSKIDSVTKGKLLKATLSTGSVIEAEKILVAVGRTPNTDSIGLERVGIKIDGGRICVDEHLRACENIYAIGDCISGPLLAHKASYDGILACDNILGGKKRADYSNIPNCIWTEPEIASVGFSEEEAIAKNPGVKVARFPYLASGRACLEGKADGFVKIVGTSGGDILGVEILGKGACDLIAEAVLARAARMKIRDWSDVVHSHPTMSEILQEAARVFCGIPIHSI